MHPQGYTVDQVIGQDSDILSIDIKDLAISDHFCVPLKLHIIPRVQAISVSMTKRFITEHTSTLCVVTIAVSSTVDA